MNELPEIKIIDIGYASAGYIEYIATPPAEGISLLERHLSDEQSAPSDDG